MAIPDLPELADEKIRLRPWRISDAPALVEAWSDPEVTGRFPVPDQRDLGDAERWIDGWESRRRVGLALDLVVTEIPDDSVLGEVGISHIDPNRRAALVGWWLFVGSRGRGLASRAVTLVAGWAFGSGWLDALVAEIDADNDRSTRIAARCGFELLTERDARQVHVLRNPQGRVIRVRPGS